PTEIEAESVLVNQSSWSRRAIALHGISSGLEDDGRSADAAGNSADGEADRTQRRSSLVYTGNIHDPGGQSTFCHECSTLLVGRDWYNITEWHLSPDGRCVACGTPCHGVFEATAGRWGARRLPLKLARTAKLHSTPCTQDSA